MNRARTMRSHELGELEQRSLSRLAKSMCTNHRRDSAVSIHHESSCGDDVGRVNLDLLQKFCRLLPRVEHDQCR